MMNGFSERGAQLRWLLGLATCVSLLAGCRKDPYLAAHIEILNSERRALEDRMYELEYDYERALHRLQDAEAELAELRGDSAPSRRTPSPTRSPSSTQPPPRQGDEDFDLSPPTVTPGVPDEPRIEIPDLSPEDNASQLHGPGNAPAAMRQPSSLSPSDDRITHIYLDQQATGGVNLDGKPGDDGVSIVIEPRNTGEEFIPSPGAVSVALLDYAKRDSEEARVARWELSAEQVQESLRDNSSQRGIHLVLPWPDSPPENSKLLLAVRYVTADGRKLEIRRDIAVSLTEQYSRRWTPRASGNAAGRVEGDMSVARRTTTPTVVPPTTQPQQRGAPRSPSADYPATSSQPLPQWRPTR